MSSSPRKHPHLHVLQEDDKSEAPAVFPRAVKRVGRSSVIAFKTEVNLKRRPQSEAGFVSLT